MSATGPTAPRGDLAIVGMAGLFPQADTLAEFWDNILAGVDAITEAPAEDPWGVWNFRDFSGAQPETSYCPRGGFLTRLPDFDPMAFGVPPSAVAGGDPAQWLVLQVARAALQDAGYSGPVPERDRTAVLMAHSRFLDAGSAAAVQHSTIVRQTLEVISVLCPHYSPEDLAALRQSLHDRLPPFTADAAAGIIPNVLGSRVAHRLDLRGPCYTVEAACASSLVALQVAGDYLRARRCDLALVAAAHLDTGSLVWSTLSRLGVLSRSGNLRPFDRGADGTLLGEGVGVVILKRREDAGRAGDRVYALVRGVGVSHGGAEGSFMAPGPEGEAEALARAYADAQVDPCTVELIEAHGLGVPGADEVELAALRRVFGTRSGASPTCALGSVKSMIGHLLPAGGMAGLLKTALALHHRVLPPTLHVTEPHPALQLADSPFYLNTETRPWAHDPSGPPRRAGVSAFGFGGVNAHAVLEAYPASGASPRPTPVASLPAETLVRLDRRWPGLTVAPELVERLATGTDQLSADHTVQRLRAALASGENREQIVSRYLAVLSELLAAEREAVREYFAGEAEAPSARPWATVEAHPAARGCHAHLVSGSALADTDALAQQILGPEEQALFASLGQPPERRRQWLLGRLAAKGALRQCLESDLGQPPLDPHDLQVLPDERASLQLRLPPEVELPRPVRISLAHTGDYAVALATAREDALAVGIDLERVSELPAGVAELAFTPAERDLLAALDPAADESWPLRLWCAKEAAGKALGRGLSDGPQALVVTQAEAATGAVTVAYHAGDDSASPTESLPVQTLLAEGLLCAWCVRLS
jgi:acyl transferase domain-containing protein/phosphopantetheinyl transferase